MPLDIAVVLEDDLSAYLILPTKAVNIGKSAKTPEEAACNLRRDIAPGLVKCAFVVSDAGFELRQSCVKALQKVGFTDVETIDKLSIKVSSCIFNLPLHCEIDEPVFVYIQSGSLEYKPVVIKKCTDGFQIINTKPNVDNICNEHPSARNIIIPEGSLSLAEIQTLYAEKRVHEYTPNDSKFKERFIRNRINKNDLNGYEVLPYCGVSLSIVYGNKLNIIKLDDRVPPFVLSKKIDVGDADDVKAGILKLNDNNETIPVIEYLTFKDKAHRILSVEVSVSETLLPKVTLKTASTLKPPEIHNPFIYKVAQSGPTWTLDVIFPEHVINEGYFTSTEKLLAHMTKAYSMKLVADIYFVTKENNLRSQLRNFRTACQTAGFSNVTFLSAESLYLSLLIDRAKVSIKPTEMIGVLSAEAYRVIGRDGKKLKIVKRIHFADFNATKSTVTTVVIDNTRKMFTETDIRHIRSKFSQRVVHIITEEEQPSQMVQYFCSRHNGTDFGGNLFNDFGDFQFAVEETGHKSETVNTWFTPIPFEWSAIYPVVAAKLLRINIQGVGVAENLAEYDVKPGIMVKLTITVETACDITVDMKPVAADTNQQSESNTDKTVGLADNLNGSTDDAKKKEADVRKKKKKKKKKKAKSAKIVSIEPEKFSTAFESKLSNLKLDPVPSAVLTFTSDNRVLIDTHKTYTGTKEILAYVRLQIGKPPETGKIPFNALKTDPSSVFYG